MDIVEFINLEIANFICGPRQHERSSHLVKKNCDNFNIVGEFSFPLNKITWQKNFILDDSTVGLVEKQINRILKDNLPNERQQVIDELLERSKSWRTPLAKISLEGKRCLLHVLREESIQYALDSVMNKELFQGLTNKIPRNTHFRACIQKDAVDLNSYRVSLVAMVLQNLMEYVKDDDANTDRRVVVDVRPMKDKGKIPLVDSSQSATVYCGNVIDDGHKVAVISKEDYLSLRSKDMQLIAMHKYGVRVKNEEHFRILINQLGEAATKVDLLEAKHSAPVSVKRNGQGCTKGAAFLLYNSARIETLLRSFEERVRNGDYPCLPPAEQIDCRLLKEEEEWKMIFNYILGFPHLIKRTLDGINEGKCAPHILLQFLCSFVSTFSVYYRRVRVLLDGRKHLIPVIHARIYLVHCLRIVFNRVLAIFGIASVQYM